MPQPTAPPVMRAVDGLSRSSSGFVNPIDSGSAFLWKMESRWLSVLDKHSPSCYTLVAVHSQAFHVYFVGNLAQSSISEPVNVYLILPQETTNFKVNVIGIIASNRAFCFYSFTLLSKM